MGYDLTGRDMPIRFQCTAMMLCVTWSMCIRTNVLTDMHIVPAEGAF